MLEVNQLTRNYDDLVAVDNVSFKIGQGEIVGLLGHNGAGKTTIMKIVSGYLEADKGSVVVDNVDLSTHSKTVQLALGYLPENLPIYQEMTVSEYLDYAADLKGINPQIKHREIRRVVIDTDISQKLLSPISTLSRGFKQRVGVAQAILGQPKLLILDEPTNGLDPEQTQHMRELIRQIAKNATVILSTHIMQEVDALCTRVLMLRAGKLVVDAQLEELRNSDQISLQTSMPDAHISSIRDLEQIEMIEQQTKDPENAKDPENGDYDYKITVRPGESAKNICSEIAKIVISQNHKLYSLHSVQRDLETLFKEVNEKDFSQLEEVNNAA